MLYLTGLPSKSILSNSDFLVHIKFITTDFFCMILSRWWTSFLMFKVSNVRLVWESKNKSEAIEIIQSCVFWFYNRVMAAVAMYWCSRRITGNFSNRSSLHIPALRSPKHGTHIRNVLPIIAAMDCTIRERIERTK